MEGASRFDLVVIGSGPGGYVAAIRGAQLGLSTAIVEKDEALGGTCLNVGCIPSKALLDSSELYATAREGLAPHGITAGAVSIDIPVLMARKEKIVATFTGSVAALMKANGVTVFRGTGRLLSASRVEVTGAGGHSVLEAGAVILATGSVPVQVPSLPFDGKTVVSSTEALAFREVPRRLVVVGAGAIGLELGSVWMRLGSRVTVVEMKDQILPGWDSRVSQTLRRLLEKQGMGIHTGTAVTGLGAGKTGAVVRAKAPDGAEKAFDGDVVLVAVGRRPYTDGLGLPEAGVGTDPRSGRVVVDGKLRTSLPTVFAIGDIAAGPMLAHKAEEEGIAAAESAAGRSGHVDYGVIPSVVYTAPEAAGVGKTEDELKAAGARYVTGSYVFRANGRALALNQPEGFVKVLAEEGTDRVLGVHAVGPFASELMAEAAAVMAFGGSSEDIARTAHAHPSLSEVTREAALAAGGRAIHVPPARAAKERGEKA
jgi:dihydrolipoamide dehydrogenase